MSASLRTEYWAMSRTAAKRDAARAAGATLAGAGAGAVTEAPDPRGYFYRPDAGRSLGLQDGINRGHAADPRRSGGSGDQRYATADAKQQQPAMHGAKEHHVLWSAAEPWGSVPYQSSREAIHAVRATPGFRAGLGEKGYSRLAQKKPVLLNEVRKFMAGLGLQLYTEQLQRRFQVVTPEDLLNIRRPQLEAVGMPRPDILIFERAVKELARDYVKRNRESTVTRRVYGTSAGAGGGDDGPPAVGAAVKELAQRQHGVGRGAWAVAGYAGHHPGQGHAEGEAEQLHVGAGPGIAETLAEMEERHVWLGKMRQLNRSGVHEAAMKREMTQRMHQLEDIDQAGSMATLWKEAQATHPHGSSGSSRGAARGAKEEGRRAPASAAAAAEAMAIENYIKRYPDRSNDSK